MIHPTESYMFKNNDRSTLETAIETQSRVVPSYVKQYTHRNQ